MATSMRYIKFNESINLYAGGETYPGRSSIKYGIVPVATTTNEISDLHYNYYMSAYRFLDYTISDILPSSSAAVESGIYTKFLVGFAVSNGLNNNSIFLSVNNTILTENYNSLADIPGFAMFQTNSILAEGSKHPSFEYQYMPPNFPNKKVYKLTSSLAFISKGRVANTVSIYINNNKADINSDNDIISKCTKYQIVSAPYNDLIDGYDVTSGSFSSKNQTYKLSNTANLYIVKTHFVKTAYSFQDDNNRTIDSEKPVTYLKAKTTTGSVITIPNDTDFYVDIFSTGITENDRYYSIVAWPYMEDKMVKRVHTNNMAKLNRRDHNVIYTDGKNNYDYVKNVLNTANGL